MNVLADFSVSAQKDPEVPELNLRSDIRHVGKMLRVRVTLERLDFHGACEESKASFIILSCLDVGFLYGSITEGPSDQRPPQKRLDESRATLH